MNLIQQKVTLSANREKKMLVVNENERRLEERCGVIREGMEVEELIRQASDNHEYY